MKIEKYTVETYCMPGTLYNLFDPDNNLQGMLQDRKRAQTLGSQEIT